MNIWFLQNVLKKHISALLVKQDIIIITIKSSSFLPLVIEFLQKSFFFQMTQLLDLFAVDLQGKGQKRFQINILLNSIFYNKRILLKVLVNDFEKIPTLSNIFPSSNWLERETYDMYGVYFDNHPDLRRILTDYGFEGYPLRKDFPLSGYLEVRFDDELNRVVFEPLSITQEYRNFVFVSPWEHQV